MIDYPSLQIIPITELRRNFGRITANLAAMDEIILTREGSPFAVLKSAPEEKRKILRKSAGMWTNTDLDKDIFWKKILDRKSRVNPISL